jgi:two-component system NtrC family sensor kinase
MEEKYRVLIADDDASVRTRLSDLIAIKGYAVDTAPNGMEALDKAKETAPDIILLDVLMPEMDGIEACKRLKSITETMHIPVIMITSFEDKEIKMKCLEAGAADFLSKSVDHIELAMRIKNLLQFKYVEEIKARNEALGESIKAIEKAKREWEMVMDCLRDAVILIDADDRIVRCNKAFSEITGRSFKELLHNKWQDVFRECGFENAVGNIGNMELCGNDRCFDYGIYVKDELLSSGYAALIALRDITDRRKAEKTLESQHKEIEKAYADLKSAQSQILQQEKMASIGQLAAGIAHEINNPVGFIMSNLGSLQRYADKLTEFVRAQSGALGDIKEGQDIKTALNKVDENKRALKIDYITEDINNLIRESLDGTERVKKIVQDLKSFSRVDEAERKMADINSGIESTINIVWNELKYKANVKKEYGDIPMTKCNPGQLNQVFMNMLVNAAHAIEKQGEIGVKTWHEDGHIYISISDTGSGIQPENIGRIFEPFFTTKEVGKGTGLGLSIAYDIVKKHNGEITVESEIGKGTVFIIKIPVVK